MAEYDMRVHDSKLIHIPTRIRMLEQEASDLAFNQARDDLAHEKLGEAKRLENYMRENNTELKPRF